jgi:hypothetical protein
MNTGASNIPAWDQIRFELGNAITADFDFALIDGWTTRTDASATPWTGTIRTNATIAFPIGTVIYLDVRATAATLTIAPEAGVTLDGKGQSLAGAGGLTILPGYKGILVKVNTNTWTLLTDSPVTTGQGVLYAGFADASAVGSSVMNTAAAGWTVSNPGVGQFTVTHNLGLAAATDLAITATVRLSAGGTDDRYCLVTNETVNAFTVLVLDQGAGAVDDDFYFQATRLV